MGTVFRLTGDAVQPAPGVRILRADEYSRLLEAGALLAAARERAEAIRAEAEHAYEARKRAGYEDGVMEGRMEQAEKMMETAMQAVEYIENIEETLVKVVSSAVRKIIGELEGSLGVAAPMVVHIGQGLVVNADFKIKPLSHFSFFLSTLYFFLALPVL